MKEDAHYYGVLAFSRACGFSKAHAWDVAYASQFVDDAKIDRITVARMPEVEVQRDMKQMPDGKMAFYDMATCHSYKRLRTFNYSSMVNNTVAFHFVPGCEGANFAKKMRCLEQGGAGHIIGSIAEEALAHGNPIELGIVLHALADTFSHQGFSGLISKVNDIEYGKIEGGTGRFMDKIPSPVKLWKNKLLSKIDDKFLPAYGHAQALNYPDLPYLSWSYSYDQTDDFDDVFQPCRKNTDNVAQFKKAFQAIKILLDRFLEKHPQYADKDVPQVDFESLFSSLVAKKSDRGRIKNWRKTMLDNNLFSKEDEMLKYQKDLWLKSAFANYDKKLFDDRTVSRAVPAEKFEQSKWFSYYKATHWYKSSFFKYASIAGVAIPR